MPGEPYVSNLPEHLLDQIADAIAARVVDRLRAGEFAGLIDQSGSPLGPRRHCALARRLISAGDRRACRIGRRWLIERSAIEQELGAPAPDNNELLHELGLEES